MEYCFLKGCLVVLLIQQGTSEGLSTSSQSLTGVTLEDGQALLKETEVPPPDVVPLVAHPSLKEVQQAVQEASEQVEGRGAEEVLKELLERVVEAALSQGGGGGIAKEDKAAAQEVAEEDDLAAEKREDEVNIDQEVLEHMVEEEVKGENVGTKGGEEQKVVQVNAFKDVAKERKGIVKEEGKTPAGPMEETTAAAETEGREADRVDVIKQSLDTDIIKLVVEETVAALAETGGDLAVQGAEVEQVVLSEEKMAAETKKQESEETPAVMEVELDREESEPSVVVADVEQIEDLWGKEEAPQEETQVDELGGEVTVRPSDNYEIKTTPTVAKELVEQEMVNTVNNAKVSEKQPDLVIEGGAAEESEHREFGEAAGHQTDGESEITEESVGLVNEGGVQQTEEEHDASKTLDGSDTEDQEVLVISAPEPEDGAEASIQLSPENQVPTLTPFSDGVVTGENILGHEKSNHGNEIITPTDDLLPHHPVAVQPTLDNFVKDILAEPPKSKAEEPGETKELVEDTETGGLGLEAWKIGAISAAVFLVLEAVVTVIYIFKCRNKSSTPALQRECEEGCVEPEEATGGDCDDDMIPAVNGDTQQIAALDPTDVASTLAQNKEQYKDDHAVGMSDLPPSSTEDSVNTGPGPDSSQDLRTSIL